MGTDLLEAAVNVARVLERIVTGDELEHVIRR